MSLTIFSTLVLSLIFVIVLSAWQVGHGSALSQLAMLAALLMVLLSFSLLMLRKSLFSSTQKPGTSPSVFDGAIWSTQISAGLSTPAAVIRGYTVGFANRPFLEELGMPNMAEELVGMPLTNLVHPKDHQSLAKLITEIGSNSHAIASTIKLRLIRFDGSTPAFDVSLSRLSNDTQEPLLLLQFNLGNASKATLDHQFNYRLFVEHIEQIIFQNNLQGRLIFVNPSWEKLLNQSAEEVIQQPFLSFIHPEDRPIAESHLNAIRFGKRASCHLEVRMISRNGDANWFEMRARATSSAEGEKTSIIGTLTDIHRSKQTEAALRANRQSLSTLLSNIPAMIYRAKNINSSQHYSKGSMEFISDGCVDITGYEAHELIDNEDYAYPQIIHEGDRQFVRNYVQEQLAKRQRFALTYRIHSRSNQIRWVMEYGTGVFSSADELLATEGFIIVAPATENHAEFASAIRILDWQPYEQI